MVTECGFAEPGTYGHECGNPSVSVAVFHSKETKTGIYYTGRCEKHGPGRKDGENSGVIRFEPVAGQVNVWK